MSVVLLSFPVGCGGDAFSSSSEPEAQAGAGGDVGGPGGTTGEGGQAGSGEPGGTSAGGAGDSGQGGSDSAGTGGSGEGGAGNTGVSGSSGQGGSDNPAGSGGSGQAGSGGSDAGSGGSTAGTGGAGGAPGCPPGTVATGGRCLTFGGVYQRTGEDCVVANPLAESSSNSPCSCPGGFAAQEIDTQVPAGKTTLGFCGRTDGADGLWGGVYLLNKAVTDGCYENNPLAGGQCSCSPGDSADYSVTEGLLMKAAGSGWSGYLGLSICYPGDPDAIKSVPSWETFHGMFFSLPSGSPACLSGNPLLSLDKPVCDCLPGDKKVLLKVLTQGASGNALGDLTVCLNEQG